MALKTFSIWLLLLIGCTHARLNLDATSLLSCPSLPPPDLVNGFPVRDCTDADPLCTNSLTADHWQSLQLIKCQSLGTKAGGQSFDFYQVKQANESEACKRPPPLECKVHRRQVTLSGRWFWHASVVVIFIGFLVIGFLGGCFVFQLICLLLTGFAFGSFWLWMQLLDALGVSQPLPVDQENPSQQADEIASKVDEIAFFKEALESDISRSYWTKLDQLPSCFRILDPATGASLKSAVMMAFQCFAAIVMALMGAAFLGALIFAAVLAAEKTPEAEKCLYLETSVEVLGPVQLPDPAQGLNQYLSYQPGESFPTLKLCATKRLQFYTACESSCAQLGEPYGNLSPLEGPPISGCSRLKFRLFVWLSVLVGSLVIITIFVLMVQDVWSYLASRCGCGWNPSLEDGDNNTALEAIELENLDKDSA